MKKWRWLLLVAGLTVACSSNGSPAGGTTCCNASNDSGASICGCRAPGTVSAGDESATLTVNGASCTVLFTTMGNTTTFMGGVVASCPDGG